MKRSVQHHSVTELRLDLRWSDSQSDALTTPHYVNLAGIRRVYRPYWLLLRATHCLKPMGQN